MQEGFGLVWFGLVSFGFGSVWFGLVWVYITVSGSVRHDLGIHNERYPQVCDDRMNALQDEGGW